MRRALLAAGLTMTATLSLATPAHAEPSPNQLVARCTHLNVAGTPQALMLAEMNCARKLSGESALRPYKPIGGIASAWSAHMAQTQQLAHNLARAGQVDAVDPRWQRLGEIVGATSAGGDQVDRIVSQWFLSSVHRHVILNPGLHVVGIGLKPGGGWVWATCDFVDQ